MRLSAAIICKVGLLNFGVPIDRENADGEMGGGWSL
jgi:hypothetical protein